MDDQTYMVIWNTQITCLTNNITTTSLSTHITMHLFTQDSNIQIVRHCRQQLVYRSIDTVPLPFRSCTEMKAEIQNM